MSKDSVFLGLNGTNKHQGIDMTDNRNPKQEPQVGDRWSEGTGINEMTHTVKLVGSEKISILYDGNSEKVLTLKTFRRYCKWRWSYEGK